MGLTKEEMETYINKRQPKQDDADDLRAAREFADNFYTALEESARRLESERPVGDIESYSIGRDMEVEFGRGGVLVDTIYGGPDLPKLDTDGYNMPTFKYGEDKILTELFDYIKSTYKQHYADEEKQIQVVDMWEAIGIAEDACQSNIIKYVARYGKKDGYNKKDLLKAMHYLVLLWHYTEDCH